MKFVIIASKISRSGKRAPKCKFDASNKSTHDPARGLKCAYLNYTAIECGCQVLILRQLSANPAQIFPAPGAGFVNFVQLNAIFAKFVEIEKKQLTRLARPPEFI